MKSGTAAPVGPANELRSHVGVSVRNTPMLIYAGFFAVGIGLTQWQWVTPAVLVYVIAVCGGLTCLATLRAPRVMLLTLCVMWCGLGWLASELEPQTTIQTEVLHDANGLSRRMTGSIERVSPIRDDGGAEQGVQLDVRLNTIEELSTNASQMVPIVGGVRLMVYEKSGVAIQHWRCGENISTNAMLHPSEKFLDPGAWDYAAYLAQQGVSVRAAVDDDAIHHDSGEAAGWHPACRIHAMQSWAGDKLKEYVGSRANNLLPSKFKLCADDAGALAAMILGDRTELDRTVKSNFVSTGSFHLFVVSGLHIALIAGIVFCLLRRMGLTEIVCLLLMLLTTSAYSLLTGLGEPVQRALAMTTLFVVARLLWRQTSSLNALGTTALVLLVATPHLLFDASLQMTAMAVLAIAGIAVPLGERSFLPYARATKKLKLVEMDASMTPHLAQFRVELRLIEMHIAEALGWRFKHLTTLLVEWALWAAELMQITLIVEIAMILPMAIWFHRIPLLALPANMIAMPLLMVMAPLGMILLLAALISPWTGLLPMIVTAGLLHFAEWFAAVLSHLHIGDMYYSQLRTPGPTLMELMLALVMFTGALIFVSRKWRWAPVFAVATLICCALVSIWPSAMLRTPQRLEVTAIDVGQGDSIFVVTPDGHTLLVDAGGPIGGPYSQSNANDASVAFDIGEEVVSPYLWSRQVRRLDAVAVTHAHSDHMGGMPAVLRNFRPHELWLGGTLDAPEEHELLVTAAELGIPVKHWTEGARFNFGGLPVRVLWPPPQMKLTARSANNDSLVMELDYGMGRALLEGDAEAPSEAGMLASGALEPVTLLKVAHHGSMTSSTEQFLNAIMPTYALLSVGRVNPFGHPKDEVIKSFGKRHVRLYRTDRMGQLTVLMDPKGNVTTSAFTSR